MQRIFLNFQIFHQMDRTMICLRQILKNSLPLYFVPQSRDFGPILRLFFPGALQVLAVKKKSKLIVRNRSFFETL